VSPPPDLNQPAGALRPDLRQRILAAAAASPAPTRAQTIKSRLWLFASAAVGAIAIFFIRGGIRPTGRPAILIALTSLGTSLIGGAGLYFLFTPQKNSVLRRPVWKLLLVAALAGIGFVIWKVGISSIYGLTARWPDRVGLRCLRLSLLTGSLPLFAALVAWRRTDPVTPLATGAAFGAGAGLASAVLVDLWCPVAYVPHLLLGHVLPIVILAGVGALIGWRVLRVRRR
jgi:hypothetical protein